MHDWSEPYRPLRQQCLRLGELDVRQPRQIALGNRTSPLVGRDWVARSRPAPRHGRRALWLLLLLPVVQAVAGTLVG
ncbi:MAG: hypothetical protein II007_09530 [Gammaproteobacteria bacterium]|nr:hypothetical protein [Gammaproteobacteria bacterium]